jgi:hypothetical protein
LVFPVSPETELVKVTLGAYKEPVALILPELVPLSIKLPVMVPPERGSLVESAPVIPVN